MDQDETSASPTGAVPVGEIESEPAPSKRKPVALLAGVVAVVVIAGAIAVVVATSSSGSKSASAITVLSSAAARTTTTGSAHLDLTVAEKGNGSRFSETISEDVDYTNHVARLDFGGVVDERIVHGNTYVMVPRLSLPKGADWVEITPDDVKLNSKELQGLAGNDISSGLQGLKNIVGTPVKTEETSVDGVNVAHYSFTIDEQDSLTSIADAASQLGMGAYTQLLHRSGVTTNASREPAEAWVDDQGRVRILQMTLKVTFEGETVTAVDTLHFTNFGETVDVTAPEPSDTVLFSQDRNVFSALNPGSS